MRNLIILFALLTSTLWPVEKSAVSVKEACDNLKSQDAEIRRSAVLVLSKYQNSSVVPKQLVLALKDRDDLVRQTAFVAISEMIGTLGLSSMNHSQFKSFKTEQFLLSCLALLSDKNVDTRRLVSSGLRTIFLVLSNDIPFKVFGKSKENRDKLVKAFSDTDPGVRYNMVASYPYINQYVSQQTLVQVIDNSKELPETQLLALSTFLRYGMEHYERYFSSLMKLPSLKQRRLVMKYCGQLRNKQLLKPFVANSDVIISSHAVYALMQKGEEFSFEFIDTLTQKLISEDLEQGKRIIRYIRSHQKLFSASKQFVKEKVKKSSSPYYQEYRKLYLAHFGTTMPVDELIDLLLTSTSADVYTITSYLRRHKKLKAEHFTKIIESDNYTAKSGLISLLNSLRDRSLKEEVALELLLDEDLKVSSRVLPLLCSLQVDGWKDIVYSMISDCEDTAFDAYAKSLVTSSYGKNCLLEIIRKDAKIKQKLMNLMKSEQPTSYYYRKYKELLEKK